MLFGRVTAVVVVVVMVAVAVVVETIHPVTVAADPVVVSAVRAVPAVRVVQVVLDVQQDVDTVGLRGVIKQTVTVKIQFSL